MDSRIKGVIILFPILIISMAIHEFMHALTADYLGDDTARLQGRLSLNPLAHIDPFFTVLLPLILIWEQSRFLFGAAKPVQVNFHRLRYSEFGGAIVGMVGPVTNLVIAGITGVLFRVVNPEIGTTVYTVFDVAIRLNVGLFIFNSIPWPPLDGSRLLYAFAPRPLQEFMEGIERMGMISILVLILLVYPLIIGPLSNIFQGLIHLLAPGLVI